MNRLTTELKNYLTERGVMEEAAQARGYREVYSGKPTGPEFAATYGFPQTAGGLLIPMHPLIGGDQRYQLRSQPGSEPTDDKGRRKKFISPAGQPNCLATSPLTRDLLAKPGQVIFVSEGVTRIDALAGFEIPGIATNGVWGWCGKNDVGGLVALDDWEHVNIKGNAFMLAPDGDITQSKGVYRGSKKLARYLSSRGAENVQLVVLPDDMGLDDWIAARGFKSQLELRSALREHVVDIETLPEPNKRQPDTQPDKLFRIDDVSDVSRSSPANIYRVLDRYPREVCIVRTANHKDDWYLLVEESGGRWSRDGTEGLLMRSAQAWHLAIAERAMKGAMKGANNGERLTAEDASKASRYAVRAMEPKGIADTMKSLRPVADRMIKEDKLPKGITVAKERDIDGDRLSIGTPDGVLDIETLKHLPREEARKRLVTRTIPDPLDLNAEHQLADALVGHLPNDNRNYLLDAMAWMLRGEPARRFYALAGPPAGGKTTLATAIHAAFGDVFAGGYVTWVDANSLMASRFRGPDAHRAGLVGMHFARIAFAEELPLYGQLDGGLIKNLSGGGAVMLRDVGERGLMRPAMATLVLIMNDDSLDVIVMDSEAIIERGHILPYPRLPMRPEERDPDHLSLVRDSWEVRQAVVAMMLNRLAGIEAPPAETPTIKAMRTERVEASIGPVGLWLSERLQVTHSHKDSVNLPALWQTLGETFEVHGDKIEGRTKRQTWSLAKQMVPNLPKGKRITGGGTAWPGVRLQSDEEVEADAPAPAEQTETADAPTFRSPSSAPPVESCPSCDPNEIVSPHAPAPYSCECGVRTGTLPEPETPGASTRPCLTVPPTGSQTSPTTVLR